MNRPLNIRPGITYNRQNITVSERTGGERTALECRARHRKRGSALTESQLAEPGNHLILRDTDEGRGNEQSASSPQILRRLTGNR